MRDEKPIARHDLLTQYGIFGLLGVRGWRGCSLAGSGEGIEISCDEGRGAYEWRNVDAERNPGASRYDADDLADQAAPGRRGWVEGRRNDLGGRVTPAPRSRGGADDKH